MAAELASSGPPGGPGARRALGRYLLCEEIACGGMAAVHLGRLATAGGAPRVVAIKRLHPQFARDPDFVSMLLDEARIAMRVQHPHVASVHELVALGGELFLVMEYLHGESLARLARAAAARGERIPPPIVAAIVAGVLHGLHAAHETTSERGDPLGIVHRDVSPQNVLVGVDGFARVLDFGVAKAVGRVQTTREGQVKGKLAYMSPEQVLGHAVDRRTDVYAAGVLAWEALAGRGLHQGDNQGVVLARVLAGAADPPSRYAADIPPAWDEIVMKALSVEPQDRYETARAMAAAIEAEVACAPAAEVGAWSARLASEELDRRAALVAAVEREEHVEMVAAEPAAEGAASPARAAPKARAYRRWSIGAAAALGGIALIAARMMGPPASPNLGSAEPIPERAIAPEIAPPVTSSAASAAPPDTAAPAVTTATPEPLPPPSASAAPARARAAAPPQATSKPAAAPPSPAAPGCSNPFVADANGVLRVRRECL